MFKSLDMEEIRVVLDACSFRFGEGGPPKFDFFQKAFTNIRKTLFLFISK